MTTKAKTRQGARDTNVNRPQPKNGRPERWRPEAGSIHVAGTTPGNGDGRAVDARRSGWFRLRRNSGGDPSLLRDAWDLTRQSDESARQARALRKLARRKRKEAKKRHRLHERKDRHSATVGQYVDEHGDDPERPVTVVRPVADDHLREVEFEPVIDGYAYVRVLWDRNIKEYTYHVIEPPLEPTEADVCAFLRDTLYRTLDGRYEVGPGTDWSAHLEQAIDEAIVDHHVLVDGVSERRIKYHLMRDFLGYGPIDVLMHDPLIEDISCDGPGIPLYVFHRQYESVRTNLKFETEEELDAFVIRLSQICGKHISLAEPLLDATLPDSSRLQATLSREVTTRGSSFSIRRFRADPLTPPDLVRLGTISPEMAAYFWLAMEAGDSILYAGGTASGKTTTLNAVCQFIPPEKKIVSIEDTREINLRHENWIASVARPGFADNGAGGGKTGTIDMYRLLESALRQRPEYLLVGEVRGEEAKTLFQAMATGHATYSTLHADSAMSAVYRLEHQPIGIPRIMLQTLDAIAIQVQARIQDRMVRRIKEVTEVVGIHPDSGDLVTNTVFRWIPGEDRHEYLGSSNILENIATLRNLKLEDVEKEMRRRAEVLAWLSDAGVRHIDEVSQIVRSYYRSPNEVVARAKAAQYVPAR